MCGHARLLAKLQAVVHRVLEKRSPSKFCFQSRRVRIIGLHHFERLPVPSDRGEASANGFRFSRQRRSTCRLFPTRAYLRKPCLHVSKLYTGETSFLRLAGLIYGLPGRHVCISLSEWPMEVGNMRLHLAYRRKPHNIAP